MESVEIKPATDADIPLLKSLPFSAGLPSKHRKRLERQHRGEVQYLLAWMGDRLIGHLLLKWDGPDHDAVRRLIPSCAEVEDFVVERDLRGKGVGSALLERADASCGEEGVRHIGLAVGEENPPARSIYEHCGFVFVPDSEHRVTWLQRDERGDEVEGHEDCVYLVKNLP